MGELFVYVLYVDDWASSLHCQRGELPVRRPFAGTCPVHVVGIFDRAKKWGKRKEFVVFVLVVVLRDIIATTGTVHTGINFPIAALSLFD